MIKKLLKILILIFITSFFLLSFVTPNTAATNEIETNENYEIFFDITVIEIDQNKREATVNILIQLRNLPLWFNETEILVRIGGSGDATILCNKTWKDNIGTHYQGQISTKWHMTGTGEMFPFDYYILKFNASPFTQFDFTISEPVCVFSSENHLILTDTWETGETIDDIPQTIINQDLLVLLQRKSAIPFFRFVLPIIFCYYILAATLLVDPQNRMSERLTIYLAIFVFVPAFFFQTASFLPHLSSFSLSEFLITNLILSTIILTFVSLIKDGNEVSVFHKKIPLDFFGLIFALVAFSILYLVLFFNTISGLVIFPQASLSYTLATIFSTIISYFIAIIALLFRLQNKPRIKKTTKKTFVLGQFKRRKRR